MKAAPIETRKEIAPVIQVRARRPRHDALKDAAGKAQPLGLIDGNAGQVLNQGIGVAIAWGLGIVGTLLILKIVDATIGLRVTKDQEVQGLDTSLHNEEGYIFEA